MSTDSSTQSVLFPTLVGKPVVAEFDQTVVSSDGGAVLLKAADERLGLSETLAECVSDGRQPGKVRHTVLEAMRQRVFGIALGYPDANDAHALADDPIHKLLLGRDPIDGDSLASQSTISRLENSVRAVDLYRMADALAALVIDRHRRRLGTRAKRIELEFDPTDDPTHGQQEFTFYHGYYDTHCYLPLVGTVRFNNEVERYALCTVLRPGNAAAHLGLVAVLRRVLERIRAAFGARVRLRVVLDGGFGAPGVLDFLDAAGVDYIVGLSATKPLTRRASQALAQARRLRRQSGRTKQVYGETMHKTKTTWPYRRRVVYKAEVVQYWDREPRDNVRFVVTNLRCSPKRVYRTYCQRGEMENRIKELKNDLAMDRTSCSRFLANQFRVLVTMAAYVLMQEVRLKARHTACSRAQVSTLRDRLLKLAVWVTTSVRRVVLHLPAAFPGLSDWQRIACALGARAG